jgi:hypothetical protein
MEKLEGKQGAQVGDGGDLSGSGEAGGGDLGVELQASQEEGEEEKEGSAAGDFPPRGEVEFLDVSNRKGVLRRGPELGPGPSGEPPYPFRFEDKPDGGVADGAPLSGQSVGDVPSGEALMTKREDLLAQRPDHGTVARPPTGEIAEVGGDSLLTETNGEDMDGGGGVAEATLDLSGGETLDEVGPEGLVAVLEGVLRAEEQFAALAHTIVTPLDNI